MGVVRAVELMPAATRCVGILAAVLVGVLISLGVSGCTASDPALTLPLNSVNDSGISGTAQLIPRGNQTQVIIRVNGEPAGASEPAHIHDGQCGPNLGKVIYPLKNVEGGRSDMLVNASLSTITSGQHAINVHQSAQNLGTSVACGTIPMP